MLRTSLFSQLEQSGSLSPAYDLLPSNGFNGFHTTTINNNGEPTTDDILAVAARVGLNKKQTIEIMQEVNTLVRENKIKM